jgi:hypothetical protein
MTFLLLGLDFVPADLRSIGNVRAKNEEIRGLLLRRKAPVTNRC